MKTIIIVGAGKGIGLELARQLSPTNQVIAITRSKSEALEQTAATIHYADVTADNWFEGMTVPDVVDGLVYCPGSIQLKPFNRLKRADFLSDFSVNVMAAVEIIQHFLPALKRSGHGSVVLFSSVAAGTGMSFHSSIAVSKAGIEALVRSLSAEFATSAIRFNAIAPSLTETSLATSLINTPEKKDAAAKRHPLQRIGDPVEVAALAAFLLSENAGWITGQCIAVDGGMSRMR